MDPREERGLLIAAISRITQSADGRFLVPSQSGKGLYQVQLDPDYPTCTCSDFEERQQACKHVFAARFVVRRETNPDGSLNLPKGITLTQESTVAPRPTYRQNWRAYNAAQTGEKSKFLSLLHDLCQGIHEPGPTGRQGRPKNSPRDMLFSLVFKVYTRFSARRFQSDLDDAFAKGYLRKAPRYNTVITYFENPNVTPILERLVVESSLPLRQVENKFAVDSTGFSTGRNFSWYDQKHRALRKKRDWITMHVASGTKTNVIAYAKILPKTDNDCPQLPEMIARTSDSFRIREVSADKEYLSAENVDVITRVGATPYIAIKKNTTGGVGGNFGRMYHRFCLDREDYLKHYHARSNVESTFSMIKRKFGEDVHSKKPVSMENECLGKVLCHNICCLIHEIQELKIEVNFWRDVSDPSWEPLGMLPENETFESKWNWV